MRPSSSIAAFVACVLFLMIASSASVLGVQSPVLRGTIKDPSGAVMASVDVSVIQGGRVVKATKTDSLGAFSFELPAGQYQLAVTAPDFNTYMQTVRVTPGMQALSATLSLQGTTATLDVVGNDNKVTVDAALSLDATTLTGDQISDLPEDEESLLALLQALAGGEGNAQLIIDGFEGGRLPTRDQIAQIVIEPNSFNANGTGPRITITTKQPGPTRWAGNATFQYRDSALNARTPNALNKAPSRRSVISTSYNGPVIKGKLGMTISLSKQQSDGNQFGSGNSTIRAITPAGPVNQSFFSPSTNDSVGLSQNWYLSMTHTMYINLNYSRSQNRNQGIGSFTLAERAYDSSDHGWNMQVSDSKTISPKMTNTFQFRATRSNSQSTPRTNAIAINVLDAFFGGGAQNRSVSRETTFYLNDTLRWTPTPKWNFQFYLTLNHDHNYNLSESNYLGTYTFSSLDDYLAGHPLTFTQTSGNPVADLRQSDANTSVQVTYRIKPTMSYSIGAQYAVQSHLRDYNNVSPTSQFQVQIKKRSIISLGARLTHPTVGFPMYYYEQLLRGDGSIRQFNTIISNPTYPDPFGGGTATTAGVGSTRQLRDEHLESPSTINTQLSLNESLPKNWRFTTTFGINRTVHQIRSRNINAPFPGTPLSPLLTLDEVNRLRPFYPFTARINRFESVGNSFSRNLNVLLQLPSTKVLKTQISGTFQYTLNWAEDDSAAENPYNVRADWARNDQRQRFQSSFSIRPWKAGSFSFNMNANSGRAYSITTGHDDNLDQSINDRPAGVKRNSLRGPGQYTVNLNYTSPPLNFRQKKQPVDAAKGAAGATAVSSTNAQDALIQSALNAGLPLAAIQQLISSISTQPGFILGPNGAPATPTAPPTLLHPRITFSANVQNLLNNTRVNGYSGVITSPLFGKPTTWGAGRSIQLSLNTTF